MDHALDSLWENDMLEVVPIAPSEPSLNEETVAAARALELSRELSRKRKRGAAPQVVTSSPYAMPSWRQPPMFLK